METGPNFAARKQMPSQLVLRQRLFGPIRKTLFRTEVPGLGWSSPSVADGVVYLTTAVTNGSEVSLRDLAIDASSGKAPPSGRVEQSEVRVGLILPLALKPISSRLTMDARAPLGLSCAREAF